MAYSASALSFMLEGLGKPVIFTGSQIPLCELRSDGKDNLITSVMIAAEGKVREVCLYFCNVLLRGNRAMKFSSDGLIAFTSPNYTELAKAGISIEYREKAFLDVDPDSRMTVRRLKNTRLGVVKVFPGIQFDLFTPIVHDDLQGLILETFGSGNIPNYDETLSNLIEEAAKIGAVVVVCTQCPQGSVRLGTYEAGSALVDAGAVSGFNMTTEAAVAKLQYLLSQDLNHDQVRELMETNLRGELDK
jgi:L-asparaginase